MVRTLVERVGGQAGDLGVAEEDPVRDVAGDAGGDEPDGERPGGDVADVLDHGADLELLAPVERALRDQDGRRAPGRAWGPAAWRPVGPGEIPIGPWSRPGPLVGDPRVDRLGEEVAVLDDRDRELRGRAERRRLDRRQGDLLDDVGALERGDRRDGDVADGHVAVPARAASPSGVRTIRARVGGALPWPLFLICSVTLNVSPQEITPGVDVGDRRRPRTPCRSGRPASCCETIDRPTCRARAPARPCRSMLASGIASCGVNLQGDVERLGGRGGRRDVG